MPVVAEVVGIGVAGQHADADGQVAMKANITTDPQKMPAGASCAGAGKDIDGTWWETRGRRCGLSRSAMMTGCRRRNQKSRLTDLANIGDRARAGARSETLEETSNRSPGPRPPHQQYRWNAPPR